MPFQNRRTNIKPVSVRMDVFDLERVRLAAKRARQSLNQYFVTAALDYATRQAKLARAKTRPPAAAPQ